MVKWKIRDLERMTTIDIQLFIMMIDQCSTQEPRIKCELGTSKTMFNRHFPNAGDAEIQLILCIVY